MNVAGSISSRDLGGAAPPLHSFVQEGLCLPDQLHGLGEDFSDLVLRDPESHEKEKKKFPPSSSIYPIFSACFSVREGKLLSWLVR